MHGPIAARRSSGSLLNSSRSICTAPADNLGRRSTPSGMDGTHRPLAPVEQQDGNAIRCADADCLSDFIRDERIALGLTVCEESSVADDIGMDLP